MENLHTNAYKGINCSKFLYARNFRKIHKNPMHSTLLIEALPDHRGWRGGGITPVAPPGKSAPDLCYLNDNLKNFKRRKC